MRPPDLKPEGQDYERLAHEEIEHYNKIFLEDQSEVGQQARETLQQPVPRSWIEIETRASALVIARTGADLMGHVLARLQGSDGVRMLSLGSGPGGIELSLARQAPSSKITCIDLNPSLVELGQQRADQEGLPVLFRTGDLNLIELDSAAYDVVFCHASLHHVLELERVAGQILRSLRDGGELITVDVSTRNGYLMWPETRDVVRALFRTLPPRFRINHTGYGAARIDDDVWEMDTSSGSMECIRSGDIIPILTSTFRSKQFVPYFSISRRFFDTMYGPNYDLSQPMDQALLNWIWELDVHYLETKLLKPETFFGIFGR